MKDDNPYKTPHSGLVKELVPDSFRNGSIQPGQLLLAGWLSILIGIISVPFLIFSFTSTESESEFYHVLSQTFTVISSLIWIYLLIVLQKFVKARFNLSGLGVYIKLLIVVTVVGMILSFFMEPQEQAGEFSAVIIGYFLLFIPDGILVILLGKKLLSIDEPFPYLKAFSWVTIAYGICFATVVLFLLAIPISLVADILLALIFFKGYKELVSSRKCYDS